MTDDGGIAPRVGVIGAGMMGWVHVRTLLRSRNVEVTAVAARGGPSAAALAREAGIPRAHDDALQLIADPSVDAVVIASPDETHAPYLHACVDAGKPVFCEKPLATTGGEALEVLRAESAVGRRLIQVGFMRDFDETHAAVLAAVRSGSVGRPLMFRSAHVTPDDAAALLSADQLIVMGLIHDFHSARRLMSHEFDEVFVRNMPVHASHPDSCHLLTVSCSFDDGTLGLMDLNIDARYGYAVSVEVVGSLGTVASRAPGLVMLRTPFEERRDIPRDPVTRYARAYASELEAWVESLVTGQPAGADAWDGYASLCVADACRSSLASGAPRRVDMEPRFGLYA